MGRERRGGDETGNPGNRIGVERHLPPEASEDSYKGIHMTQFLRGSEGKGGIFWLHRRIEEEESKLLICMSPGYETSAPSLWGCTSVKCLVFPQKAEFISLKYCTGLPPL